MMTDVLDGTATIAVSIGALESACVGVGVIVDVGVFVGV